MSTIHILIATYGEQRWSDLAHERALPSARAQGADVVSCLHLEDATISQVRNQMAEESECDWLIFLDADDELRHGYVAGMRDAIKRAKSDLVLLQPRVSYVIDGRHRSPSFLSKRGGLEDDNYLVVGTGISRRLFTEVGGFGEYPHGFEDWSLWAKAWKAGAKVVDVPRSVYIAHVNPNSAHRTAWRDRRWQEEMHHKVRRDLFPEKYA